MNLLRSHLPPFSEALACGMLRESANIIAIVCSQAAIMLPSGAFATIMPFCVAAGTSTLSMPTPALAMIFKCFAASMTSLVTWVSLLMISAS